MYEKLKQEVYKANMYLANNKLITLTWGNASGIDRQLNVVAIKPSGVAYDDLRVEDIVIVDLFTGDVIEGDLNPSSDTPTHLELYRSFPLVGGIVHTHSTWATILAQQGEDLKPYGTTHADSFYGSIPCTRKLTEEEIANNYELITGKVIVESFRNIDYMTVPAVLVKQHGPFTWGSNALKAAENALILEEVAKMGYFTRNGSATNIGVDQYLLDKHYLRKHGNKAYYGQKKRK